MSEYISREEVLEHEATLEGYSSLQFVLIDDIKSIPSADVKEIIHGHWERDTEIDGYRCSNCGSTGMDYWNGCPYCLADMRESKGLTIKVGIVGKGKPSLLNQIIPKGRERNRMSDLTGKEAIEILESQKNEHNKEELNESLDMAISALKGFAGMTNGDIFTTIYPDHEAEKVGLCMVLRPKGKKGIGDTHILVDLDFWNALYQKGGK